MSAGLKKIDDKGYGQGFVLTGTSALRYRRRCRMLLEALAPPDGGRLLEIGCGDGYLSSEMARLHTGSVVATDICCSFLDEGRESFARDNLSFHELDCKNPGALAAFVAQAPVDGIFGNGILHHLILELDEVLGLMRRTLPPGGRIAFLEPNVFNPYVYLLHKVPALRRKKRLEPDEMAFSPRFIRQKLSRAGFTDVDVQHRDFLLPNTPAALVGPVTALGALVERIPLLRAVSQSILIYAKVPSP